MRVLTAILLVFVVFSSICSAASLVPVITNGDFEQVTATDQAPGWNWLCSAPAGYTSVTDNPHSGSRCLVLTNQSGFAPNVYGRLRQTISVLPNTEYELSVWVRGENVGDKGDICHFGDWDIYRLNLPTGTFGWTRVASKLKTKPDQASLEIGINVVNSCKALAIDDLALRPVGVALKGVGIEGSFVVPMQVTGDQKPAEFVVSLSSESAARVEAVISAGKTPLYKNSVALVPGDNAFNWKWYTGTTGVKQLDVTVRVLDVQRKVLASGKQQIEKQSPNVLIAEIAAVDKRFKGEYASLLKKCQARKIPTDYPATTKAVLDQFIPIAKHDAVTGQERRCTFMIRDFNRSLDESIAEMKAYLADPKLAPNARRYTSSQLKVKGFSLIGDRIDTKGKKDRGPVFFCGMGHFGQARRDMPRWPGYGVNIIQLGEFGPSAVFPKEGVVDLTYPKLIKKALDEAAKYNVKVDILLSPHYFPKWVLDKYPYLKKGGGNMLEYCVDAPEATKVIEEYLKLVVPIFKGHPALHSFCLSNEPTFDRNKDCPNTPALWANYLQKKYGSVDVMNSRYGTSYASFEDVPHPGNENYGAPQYYDYCVFNQQRFAAWHQWMADIIHQIDPNVLVHSKLQSYMTLLRQTAAWGTNPENFCDFSQLGGNDCGAYPGTGDNAIDWGGESIWYDLLRSLGGKPIFNSENHPQPDFSTYYVAPEHYRSTLWLGAMHGQCSSTFWVWEHTHDGVRNCVYGNVMDRPGCAQAIGTICLDLNRFATEMAAIQNEASPVAVLYSSASYAKDGNFLGGFYNAYFSLYSNGVKIDFISDKKLAEGKGAKYRMIILSNATHLTDETVKGILSLPKSTQLVIMGDAPAKDPYGKDLPAEQVRELQARALIILPGAAEIWQTLHSKLAELKALPGVSVIDVKTGKPVSGVDWIPVDVNGREVVSLVNLLSKPIEIKLVKNGKAVAAKDLLSLGGRETVKTLKPVTPVLAEIAN